MLEMKNACQRCHRLLPPISHDAFICSYECTWCRDCAREPLERTCPNCGGELHQRPPRGHEPDRDTTALTRDAIVAQLRQGMLRSAT